MKGSGDAAGMKPSLAPPAAIARLRLAMSRSRYLRPTYFSGATQVFGATRMVLAHGLQDLRRPRQAAGMRGADSRHRLILAAVRLLIVLLIFCGTAHAQYPDKPIRLVVGFSAGGPTDLPARFIADRLGASLGQRVVVENRPGAAGQIATQDVLAKPRDGYNLLLCTHFEAINAAVYKSVPYTLADIAPITQVSRYYYGVVAANDVPARDWDEFVAYARANPGRLNYGMLGKGSAQHILALELR